MTPVELSRTVLCAVRRAVDDGELNVVVPARAVVERPRPGGCGDYSTNVALQLAGPAGRAPRQVAELLSRRLADSPGIAGVEVTGPGFLNLTLAADDPGALVREILARGGRYGHSDVLAGQRFELRVPYEVRAEVVADSVSRILATQGAEAHVSHDESAGPGGARIVPLRPVPAPADPAVLGRDAARWALLLPAAHDRPRIAGEHLEQRESNPLFRVRYAYARTRALTRNAAALGFTAEPGDVRDTTHTTDTTDTTATAGLAPGEAALAAYPQALALAARHYAPDRLGRHLVLVADAFLAFQHTVLPQGEEKPSAAHRARLALAEAAGAVLAGGLSLLGIDAPEHL
ncbi:ArgS-related anticodon-binding protein NrtL [Streptomyces sp. NPDC058067]|uniref:ArgS-related anticodon-binding protein NrtL n=1 Tax=Streptomyces sp. NPDC058067 TaxID=3346324 RepID=UPI0036E57950